MALLVLSGHMAVLTMLVLVLAMALYDLLAIAVLTMTTVSYGSYGLT